MNINDLTIGQAKELAAMFGGQSNQRSIWQIGENYLIRTVTHIVTGRLVEYSDKELVLEDAAWIADTGRWANALLDTGKFNEVEPFPPGRQVIVGRGALIDAVQIDTLPREQK
jgi:hypothetical protein